MSPSHRPYRPRPLRRRGQPVVALAVLLGTWVGARAVLIGETGPALHGEVLRFALSDPAAAPIAHPPRLRTRTQAAGATPLVSWDDRTTGSGAALMPVPARPGPVPVRAPAEEAGAAPSTPRLAGGHQLLWLAGLSALALPPEVAALQVRSTGGAVVPAPPAPTTPVPTTPFHAASVHAAPALRWSADGWILWRQGGNGYPSLPGAGLSARSGTGGAYGASQAGIVVRYRLAPGSPLRPVLYARGTSALRAPHGEELAAGIALRPVQGVPAAINAELRATRRADGMVALRPAAGVVSEFPPLPLPLGLRSEAYLAAGYVGGRDATAFVDGQLRVEARLAAAGPVELRAGGGAWGGAQRGAHRLDLGPAVTLALPLGPAGARLSADWRFRVAGAAAPGNGAALTLSAGF